MSWYLYRLTAHRADFGWTMSEEEKATMMAHVEYWRVRMAEGRVLIYSPVADTHSWGMCVVQAENEAELESLRDADPAFEAGIGTIDWLLLPLPVVVDIPANA